MSKKSTKEPASYRVQLNCKILRDVITGKTPTPEICTRTEYALFLLSHAVEELARMMEEKNG
jgi:hypothetical protein